MTDYCAIGASLNKNLTCDLTSSLCFWETYCDIIVMSLNTRIHPNIRCVLKKVQQESKPCYTVPTFSSFWNICGTSVWLPSLVSFDCTVLYGKDLRILTMFYPGSRADVVPHTLLIGHLQGGTAAAGVIIIRATQERWGLHTMGVIQRRSGQTSHLEGWRQDSVLLISIIRIRKFLFIIWMFQDVGVGRC